ncbi:MAG TPA: hypothetical protein VGR26_00755 [Acidimicrobiales bacterium]|nr:hypothetical protein [Acidimicrobiales bacterium]
MPVAEEQPPDPMGDAVAQALAEVLFGARVSLTHGPASLEPADTTVEDGSASATGAGPPGWATTITIGLRPRAARLLHDGPTALGELLGVLPGAGLRAAAQLRSTVGGTDRPTPTVRRAVRDTLAAEILADYFRSRLADASPGRLIEETLDYLIELSGTRVEAHDLTHGVVVADALQDSPRLELRYPEDLRPAKRAPLLFDGKQSVLIVDPLGRARTELQRHRFDRLGGTPARPRATEGWLDSGSLVALATRALGGIGFYVRGDRSIWTFVDGQPLLVRRGEHWTAFPVELAAAISNMIGGGPAAEVVARAAYMISARPQGAILAIVEDPTALDGMVSPKDRYDLRDGIDPAAMRPETRLHHLVDAEEPDEHTVARLAALDGATVLDRAGRLVAYGAIVTTADSEHEGARTAAARRLSQTALVVLKVSVDGDITILRDGAALTTLLGHPAHSLPG